MSTGTDIRMRPAPVPVDKGLPPAARRRGRGAVIASATAYLITFVILFPLLWIVLLSFQTNDNILAHPFSFTNLTLANYEQALKTLNLLVMYKNTQILAVVSVTVGLVVSYMAAFALTRMVFRRGGRRTQTTLRYHFLAASRSPSTSCSSRCTGSTSPSACSAPTSR